MELSLLEVDISSNLSQLNDFINQFHNLVITEQLTVKTDAQGVLEVDAPISISEQQGNFVGKKILIIDRLIDNHRLILDKSLTKGLSILEEIHKIHPHYPSKIIEQLHDFKKISGKYIH